MAKGKKKAAVKKKAPAKKKAAPAKKTALSNEDAEKIMRKHLHDLLDKAGKSKAFQGKAIERVILKKSANPLNPAIEKLNSALADTKFKGFEFHSFAASDGSPITEGTHVCCTKEKGCVPC